MTKQEEIREGIALRIHTNNRSILRVVDEVSSLNCMWDKLPEYWKARYLEEADLFINYLHSQGVRLYNGEPLIEE